MEGVENDVTIKVTYKFDLWDDSCRRSNNVRHVDMSSVRQFTAREENVSGLNEPREMFRNFEMMGAFNNVPVQFLTIARKLIWKYQQVPTKKASVKAILCDSVPPNPKPAIIRQLRKSIIKAPTIGFLLSI